MRHPVPDPPVSGEQDGLAYALFLPDGQAEGGIVILHGANSAKESHFDFARAARASGLAALAFDARGHGRSQGAFGPGAIDDVLAMGALLRTHAPSVAVRGSSMGGFLAIQAAATDPEIAAVVAICPAPEDFLLRGLRSGDLDFRVDMDAVEPWLGGLSLERAAMELQADLLLIHAEGDEVIPSSASERLYLVAAEPKRLLILPGGHHRSLQHDGEVQAETIRFLRSVLGRDRGPNAA